MSTGMKHGIAIPHGKTTAVKELVACVGISKNDIDFDALDHQGCRIFIMTLSPIDKLALTYNFSGGWHALSQRRKKASASRSNEPKRSCRYTNRKSIDNILQIKRLHACTAFFVANVVNCFIL